MGLFQRKTEDSYGELSTFKVADSRSNVKAESGFKTKSPIMSRLKSFFSNKEVLSRIFLTVGIVVIFRFLASIPLPGIDLRVYQDFFSSSSASENNLFFATFTGGQLDSPSIVGLGIAAYIQSSIMIQLFTYVFPSLKEISKDGERGKQLINQYTRLLTLPLALMYSAAYVIFMSRRNLNESLGRAGDPQYLIESAPNSDWPTISKILFITLILTAGSLLVMWLSEIITERGIGNGSSIIITVGILAQMPSFLRYDMQSESVLNSLGYILSGNFDLFVNSRTFIMMSVILFSILTIALIVLVSESARKIPIQYARRLVQGENSNLPIKLTVTGVLPIIFASALMALPQLIVSIADQFSLPSGFASFANSLRSSFLVASSDSIADMNDVWYGLVFFVVILLFSIFYAFIVIKPDDTAENLQKSEGFILGIRPGKSTEKYIAYILTRIGFVGGIILGSIALVPIIGRVLLVALERGNLLILSSIGGTSILIVVSVVIDIIRQYNSYKATNSYSRYTNI